MSQDYEDIKAAMIAKKTVLRPPPEGEEYFMPPGATEPQLRPIEEKPEAVAEAPAAPQLKGKLPDDFPGHNALEAEGITTYAKVRKQLDTIEMISGIGPATAEKIREAMNESNPEEEEPEE